MKRHSPEMETADAERMIVSLDEAFDVYWVKCQDVVSLTLLGFHLKVI